MFFITLLSILVRLRKGSGVHRRSIPCQLALQEHTDAESILRTATEGTLAWSTQIACFSEVPVVILKRGCSNFIDRGNLLIFIDSIQQIVGNEPQLGDRVILSTPNRRLLGWGVYNPRSLYRVRVLQSLHECETHSSAILNFATVFETKLLAATALRKMLSLPSTETTVYRLVNSDGDGLSGVIIDVLNDVAVVHSGVAWLELHRNMVVKTLKRVLYLTTVVWRLRPVIHEQEGVPDAEEGVHSSNSELNFQSRVCVKENGVLFQVSLSGQKTGFYSDQRENREFLRRVAGGKSVLDLCCYTGAFAIYAALGGAKNVLGIDSSKPAVKLAEENARLNGVRETCTFQSSDILNALQIAARNQEEWDVVVLDPPKLAFSTTHLNKALARYRKLNRAAMRVVRSGGLLITCSCSGSITMDQFQKTVKEAAENLKLRLTFVRVSGASPDHVFIPSHPEGNYLKCITVRVT
eukprot:g320.t1